MTNKARRIELSNKFVDMGKALLNEGYEIKDYSVTQSGTMILLLAGLMMDQDDMIIFAELCSMFSAKKILMGLDDSQEPNHAAEVLRKREIKPKRKPKDPESPVDPQ